MPLDLATPALKRALGAALGFGALLLAGGPAAAQVRTLVIPDGSGVVIGPRSAPPPPRAMVPIYRTSRRSPRNLPPEPAPGTPLLGQGLSLLPLVAAAVLGATLPGGGSGSTTSATVRTR